MNTCSRARFVASSLSLALAASRPAYAQSSLPTLRIGAAANDDFAQAYYAADMGFFEKAGLNVEVQTFSSGAAAAEAVIGGSLDLAITTPLLLANGYLRGLPFAIVAAGPLATTKSPSTLLCVAANGPIRSAQDLIGQTVGLNVLNTVLALSLDAYLEANKVTISAVKTVEIAFPAEPPAIERGTIAAAILPEPFLASAMQKGSIRSIANPYNYIAPRFLLGAWFTSRQFVQRSPELVHRFADVIYQTARWANTHAEQSAMILAKYTKIPTDVLHSMVRATFADHMDPTDMQALLDAAVRYGALSKHLRATDLIVSA
jgi:NitT/TauT family transport system substrate-binding protein